MDVENLDALSPAELDAVLERALNPQVPVEVLYAVLDRIAPAPDAASGAVAAQHTAMPGPATQDADATAILPPLAMPQPSPPRGAATDRAVRPERPVSSKPAATPAQHPHPNAATPSAAAQANAQLAPTTVIPAVQPLPNQQPVTSATPTGNPAPQPVSPAVPPSRGAHAPSRRPAPPAAESGH